MALNNQAARELHQAALAALELRDDAPTQDKIAVLAWVLRAADQMSVAIKVSLLDDGPRGLRAAA